MIGAVDQQLINFVDFTQLCWSIVVQLYVNFNVDNVDQHLTNFVVFLGLSGCVTLLGLRVSFCAHTLECVLVRATQISLRACAYVCEAFSCRSVGGVIMASVPKEIQMHWTARVRNHLSSQFVGLVIAC